MMEIAAKIVGLSTLVVLTVCVFALTCAVWVTVMDDLKRIDREIRIARRFSSIRERGADE